MVKSGRRDRILAVARQSFTANGFDGTTVGDIAKELGVSKAAITYYFPAKTDFIVALLGPLVDRLTEIVEAAGNPSWPDGVRELLREYLVVLIESDDLARWADTDLALHKSDQPGAKLRALEQRLAEIIAQNDQGPDAHVRALAVVGGIWRPLLHEAPEVLLHHIDNIVDAAMVSFAPL